MAKFKDAHGREWTIEIDVSHMSIAREAGVDFSPKKVDETLGELIYANPEKLVSLLFDICIKQVQERSIEPRDFATGFNGKALGDAGEALAEALADFFPRTKIGRALKGKWPILLDEVDNKIVAMISKNGAGNSPASSGSTPAS